MTTSTKTTCDNVHSPSHYELCNGVETIDVIRAVLSRDEFIGYCYGNVLKYITRSKKKNGLEDLRKAKVYLDWMLDEYDTTFLEEKDHG